MRAFYVEYRNILQAASAKSPSLGDVAKSFRSRGLTACASWRFVRRRRDASTSARLCAPDGPTACCTDEFTQFYERVALSTNRAAMLSGAAPDVPDAAAELKDPYILEFLSLNDEHSESELEGALVRRLEDFLMELGGAFTFVGRQRRLRIGDEWFRVDLVFFHRELRCLVIINLKLGRFSHADAGQMHLYLNYAREHWMLPGENPPVGLILCAENDHAVARYALDGLPNKVLAAEYKTVLPDEKTLAAEMERTQRDLEAHGR